jgi:predicted ATPase
MHEGTMITNIEIQNCLSIVNASVRLSPFTLLIGANGSGKTNFLHIFTQLSTVEQRRSQLNIEKHVNYQHREQKITVQNDAEIVYSIPQDYRNPNPIEEISNVKVFSINPSVVGVNETITPKPEVKEDGRGIVPVLDALKTGDREDLFEKIERDLGKYIPEIEKLSFIPVQGGKSLQVREKGLNEPIPVSKLSEGTKFVVAFLTIIHQEFPPTLICIEEIDRGLHPRLFEKIIQVCFSITRKEHLPQIIATTHNPYIVDQFKGHEDAVIVVEKANGETSFASLAQKTAHLDVMDEDPLGELWFSGFVGGIPQKGVEH